MPANAGAGGTQVVTFSAFHPVPTAGNREAYVSPGSVDSVAHQSVIVECSPSTGAKGTAESMHTVYEIGDTA